MLKLLADVFHSEYDLFPAQFNVFYALQVGIFVIVSLFYTLFHLWYIKTISNMLYITCNDD